jgi:hypothetical protein
MSSFTFEIFIEISSPIQVIQCDTFFPFMLNVIMLGVMAPEPASKTMKLQNSCEAKDFEHK